MKPYARFWRFYERIAAPPPGGIVIARDMLDGGLFTVDVCIVTNCAFMGGNASTTVTELLALMDAGQSVLIVNCPVKRSPWKRRWMAERFLPYQKHIVAVDDVDSIRCETLIVRGPRMALKPVFGRLAKKIQTKRALYIVNNSAWSEDGKAVFDWPGLHRRVVAIGFPNSQIYPISPVIREEGKRAIAAADIPDRTAPRDWPPAFTVDDFHFAPRAQLTSPIVVGRHGRDHAGKWLEDAAEIRAAYPHRQDIVVKIMGGAATAAERLGTLPSNWVVLPFGVAGVEGYLSELDIFINFPARARDEAFGRTIIEAVLSGLPAILPPFFEATFGDLALYCEPQEVEGVIDRIAADDEGRLHYINDCRREAAERFGTHTLLKRLRENDTALPYSPRLDERSRRFRENVMPSS
ncbi:hypothetical protein [Pararhizobium gei]|uniref:hypothetical protein n=1 Tax=Pararhizobium gei TaxID=1395951 RepID=UPI0023DBA395|nr:hypothetical protein [Rhizobium gei]